MYFWIYGVGESWFDKCLKSPVSGDPFTTDMVNAPKYCWNLNDSTVPIFIDYCEANTGSKNLSEWYAKSEDYLLFHWLPMTSIFFLTEAIYCKIFRCNYLRNKRYFLNFYLYFFKFRFNFEIFQKRDDPQRWFIFELTAPKNVVR